MNPNCRQHITMTILNLAIQNERDRNFRKGLPPEHVLHGNNPYVDTKQIPIQTKDSEAQVCLLFLEVCIVIKICIIHKACLIFKIRISLALNLDRHFTMF